MDHLCKVKWWLVPAKFNFDPVSSPAALLHWRCLKVMAEALLSSTLTDLRLTYAEAIPQQVPTPAILEEDSEPSGELEVESPGMHLLPMLHAFDSHFHLDRTRRKPRLQKAASMREVEDAIPVTSTECALGMSGVAVFCDPDTNPYPGEIDTRADPGPVFSGNRSAPEALLHSEQQLRSLLPYIRPHQALVLHIRGLMDDPTGLEAFMRCLDVVREMVPPEQKIQLHCFSGTEEVIQAWLTRFPNTYFSWSGMVSKFNDTV
ncbi:hypothetical protein KP79_PYT22052 [Mizuhopecten yessoensis]|uniref:Uncharacterized protein n=1 Tax=Mizuhopecten yessoensis TaxID=6573 RepID=A0A210PYT6_MIZYE|nr:hypothetical protein KP79_PYT22052 [Mizuhopecten yessoensis]